MNNEKKYLLGLTLAELKQVAKDLCMPAFTGGQMAKWLYQQHVKSIDEMTNISKANRAKLAEEYEIGCFGYSDAQHSVDEALRSSLASFGVLFIFQLPAIIAFLFDLSMIIFLSEYVFIIIK